MAGILSLQQLQGVATAVNPNQIDIADGHTLYAPGHVIQVVSTISSNASNPNNSTQTVSSTTYTEFTSLVTSITKKVTSSKIVCISSIMLGCSAAQWNKARVLRNNSTQIYETMWYDNAAYGSGIENKPVYNFIDDVSSISAGTSITYNFQVAGNNGSSGITLNWAGGSAPLSTSTIMLMEIAV